MIDLLPDPDQQALAESVEAVLATEAPLARLRTTDGDGDHALLARLARLGWIGIAIPEALGGLGLSVVEEMLLMRAAGRHLVGTGLLATLLAAHLAAAAGDAALLAALLDGRRAAALAMPDGRGGLFRLDHREGDATLLADARGQPMLAAELPGGWQPSRSIDKAIRLERAAGPAREHGSAVLAPRLSLLATAYLVGIAERARDMAAGYARIREQFGQPIGAFQAIKHRCADMAVGCEAAWSLTVFAALALAGGRADAAFQIAAARIVAAQAAEAAARGNVQVHGGIGFTEECDAQLLVKRLQVWLQIGGDTRRHRRRLIAEPSPAAGIAA